MRRTVRHVAWRRQISTVFYLPNLADIVFTRSLYTPNRSHGVADALGTTGLDRPRSTRENPRERSLFSISSSCGASSRSSSNNDWPGRASRSRNRFSRMSYTARGRTLTAALIRLFVLTPGAFATNCASTTRADPIPSSSRCRRAATCRSSKRTPPQPLTQLLPLFHPSRPFLRSLSRRLQCRTSVQSRQDCPQRSGSRRRDYRRHALLAHIQYR